MASYNTVEGVKALHFWTGPRFDFYCLAGKHAARNRAQVMGVLLGRKATQKESGITALERAFFDAVKPTGSCLAVTRDDFAAKCCRIMAGECAACAVAVDPLAVFPGGVCLECWQGRTHNGLTVEDCREGLRLAAGR